MDASKTMDYVGYVRVSTVVQAVEGVSLDAQEAQIRRWGEQHDGEPSEVFHDDGRLLRIKRWLKRKTVIATYCTT